MLLAKRYECCVFRRTQYVLCDARCMMSDALPGGMSVCRLVSIGFEAFRRTTPYVCVVLSAMADAWSELSAE